MSRRSPKEKGFWKSRKILGATASLALATSLFPVLGATEARAGLRPDAPPKGAGMITQAGNVPSQIGGARSRSLFDQLTTDHEFSAGRAAKVTRALIEQTSGLDLPDRERLAASAVESSVVKTVRVGLPSPDFSSDSLPDVLSYEVSFEDYLSGDRTYSIKGLRGTDGQELWSTSFSERVIDVLSVPAGDLTGDGLSDVLVVTVASAPVSVGSCGSQLCFGAKGARHIWRVALLSGEDGTIVWERLIEGVHGNAFYNANLPPGLLTSDGFSMTTAAALLPVVSSDHDGDGLNDIVLNVFDEARNVHFKWTSQQGNKAFAQHHPALIATAAQVLSGKTGEILHEREQPFIPGGAVLLPAGDAVGSSTGDLLWQRELDAKSPSACHETAASYGCAGAERASLDLEMIDGATLEPAWGRTIESSRLTDAFAKVPHADLTGDGKADVLVFEEDDFGSGERRWWMRGLAGSTGESLWRHEIGSFPDAFDGTVLGAAGGGEGSDLLKLDLELKVETQSFDVIFTRIDGSNGRELFRTVHSSEPHQGFTLSVAGDADGDEVRDLIFNPVRTFAPRNSSWIVESGATGATINEGAVEGQVQLVPGPDFDADGRDDMLGSAISVGTPRWMFAMLMPAGHVPWDRRDSPAETTIRFSDDLSGAGGADILYSRVVGGDVNPISRVEALDGASGTVLWGYGDELSGPLPDPSTTPTSTPSATASPTPEPTETPVPETSEISFTEASATSGQFSDETLFEARLTDSSGDPIAGQELTFELTGAESSRSFSAMTDEDGVGLATPTLEEKPGSYQLTVRYAGDENHEGSADTSSFVIEKEHTTLELQVQGEGQSMTLRARLSDLDTPSDGISGRTIDFYSDNTLIGSDDTDDDGVATVPVPPGHRGANRTYEARFSGDDFYRASSDERSGQREGPR